MTRVSELARERREGEKVGVRERRGVWARDREIEINGDNRYRSAKVTQKPKVISFLFFNFPEKVEYEALWKIFKRYGDLTDVYLARERLKSGKRFGFVRFKRNGDLWCL